MATAVGEGIAKQNYSEPENEGLQPGGTIDSNQIHDLIFAMLRKNPNPESEIQKTMKLLANLNEDLFQITKKLQERQLEEREACQQLCHLEYRKKLASLNRKLDNLSFANNAYKENVIKTEEKINIHLMEKASSEEDRKEYYLQLRDRIEVKRKIKGAKKDIDCLKWQLLYVRRKRRKLTKPF